MPTLLQQPAVTNPDHPSPSSTTTNTLPPDDDELWYIPLLESYLKRIYGYNNVKHSGENGEISLQTNDVIRVIIRHLLPQAIADEVLNNAQHLPLNNFDLTPFVIALIMGGCVLIGALWPALLWRTAWTAALAVLGPILEFLFLRMQNAAETNYHHTTLSLRGASVVCGAAFFDTTLLTLFSATYRDVMEKNTALFILSSFGVVGGICGQILPSTAMYQLGWMNFRHELLNNNNNNTNHKHSLIRNGLYTQVIPVSPCNNFLLLSSLCHHLG